jgi:hypothetical protein
MILYLLNAYTPKYTEHKPESMPKMIKKHQQEIFTNKKLCCYWHVHVKQCGARYNFKIDVNNIRSVLSFSEHLFTHYWSKPICVQHVVDRGGSIAYIYFRASRYHIVLLPLTFFVMLISHRPLGVIFTVNASVPRD